MCGSVDCCHDGVDGLRIVDKLGSAVEISVCGHVFWEVWMDIEEVAEGEEGVWCYCLLWVRALVDWEAGGVY